MCYIQKLHGGLRIVKEMKTSCMQTASGFTMFFIQSCRALEGAAFALFHFAMWFLLDLVTIPF